LRRYSAIDLIDLWSGATPYLTSPYGVGNRSSTSTWTSTPSAGACLTSASAVYSPAGPEPTTATFSIETYATRPDAFLPAPRVPRSATPFSANAALPPR
jgi:hypothetical protein